MQLYHLDARTRSLMHAEVQHDISRGALFLSSRLSDVGRMSYVPVLLDAVARGDVTTFAAALARGGMLNAWEQSHRRGVPYVKAVPHDANHTLAEGEFNRFYIRGVCLRAAQDGIDHVEIYRAKVVRSPRWESEARIGQLVAATRLLADLRANPGVDLALGVPAGPNSGLSAKLPANTNAARIP